MMCQKCGKKNNLVATKMGMLCPKCLNNLSVKDLKKDEKKKKGENSHEESNNQNFS